MYKNNVTGRPTSFFYRGKRSARFCCSGRIEIKYLFSCLLQNNFLGVEMVFELQKPRFFYFNSISSTRRLTYTAINTKTRASFLKNACYRCIDVQWKLSFLPLSVFRGSGCEFRGDQEEAKKDKKDKKSQVDRPSRGAVGKARCGRIRQWAPYF